MARKKKSEETGNTAFAALMSGKKLSAAHQKEVKEIAEHLIDEFMREVGYEDPSDYTEPNGWRHLRLESAEGIAGIKDSDGELYLHVEADVMPIPSDMDLIQALMRAALELNCSLPGSCRVVIRGTMLLASVTLNLRTLHSSEEFGNAIHDVMALANEIDDDFKKKYGGTTRQRSGAVLAGTV
jgi:hypothetical protein